MAGVSRSIVIDVSVDDVFKVVSDYKAYEVFIPEMKRVRVGARKGNRVEVTYTLELDAGVAKKEVTYTLAHVEEGPRRITWTLRKGDMMRSNDGNWELVPEGDGKTRATYTIDLNLGLLVPRGISNIFQERAVPKLLEQFKQRAEAVFGSGAAR